MPPCPVLAGWARRYIRTRTKEREQNSRFHALTEYDDIGAKRLKVIQNGLTVPSAPEVIILCLQAAD